MDVTSYMLGKKAGGGTITETDPIFSNSAASGITNTDIGNWNDKQDELVSGTNIKTINNESILGSGNITVQGGGSTYTAGTNIEITNADVINNTIPFEKSGNYYIFGTNKSGYAIGGLGVGKDVSATSWGSVSVGNNVISRGQHLVLIGDQTNSSYTSNYSVGIGGRTDINSNKSIALGYSASVYEENLCQIGSIDANINKVKIYTSSGNKELATQDYVDTAIATAITSALGGSY